MLLRLPRVPSTGTKLPFLTTRILSGFGRGKNSVYKKIYFRIYEKIFSHMRKFIFLRKKIFRRAEGEKFSYPRKGIFMRTKIFFHAHRNFAPCPQTGNEEALPSSPYAQSVNPRDVIAGGFSKRGFIVLHDIEERVRPKTLIVSYGELGLSPRAKYKRDPAVLSVERGSISSVTIWDLRSICIVISGVRSMMTGELLVISTTTRNHRPISTTTMAIPPMRGIAFGL